MVAKKGQWGILFDLDQTLVLTSKIEYLRRQRDWQKVYRSFSETTLPPGTQAFVDSVQAMGHLGVITTSPRPYATKLLAYHRLQIPVVIAYHDITRRKPHPDPILKAAEMLKLPANQCVYIGDQAEDILSAIAATATPVCISWDGSIIGRPEAQLVKSICKSWNEVLAVLSDIVKGS